EPPTGVAKLEEQAFHQRTSGVHRIGAGLETGRASPPTARSESGHRADELSPPPGARGPAAVRRAAREILGLEISGDLIALGDGEQCAQQRNRQRMAPHAVTLLCR